MRAVALGVFCAAALQRGLGAEVAEVAARTQAALEAQRELRDAARRDAANKTAFAALEDELQGVPGRVGDDFGPRREDPQRQFEEAAEHASRLAKEASAAHDSETAGRLLNESDAALREMWNASDRLTALDAEQLRQVRKALGKVAEPTLQQQRHVVNRAEHLEHKTHRLMDPLYSMGDKAEDRADDFNDQSVDAEDATLEAARGLERRVHESMQDASDKVAAALADAARARQNTARSAGTAVDRAAMAVAAMQAVAQDLALRQAGSDAPAMGTALGVTAALSGVAGALLATGGRLWRPSSAGFQRQPLLA